MTIKNFKPGQTAYVLRRTRGRTTEHFIKRYTVLAVGRKYVKAAPEGSQHPTEFYLNDETDRYLTENKDWGERDRLFLTEEAVNDDIERDMLRLWIRKALESYKIDEYTLDQLRAVKEILEGGAYENENV